MLTCFHSQYDMNIILLPYKKTNFSNSLKKAFRFTPLSKKGCSVCQCKYSRTRFLEFDCKGTANGLDEQEQKSPMLGER